MYKLGNQFSFDYEAAKPNEKNIVQGKNYRFTILTERLLRIEYSDEGIFEDRPTELVWNRNFPKPEFKVKSELFDKALETVKEVKKHFDYFEVQEAAQKIIELVDITNKYVTDNTPWTLAKEEKMIECGIVLTTVLEIMCAVSSLIYPYCPNIAKAMAEQLSYDLSIKLDNITCDNIKIGHLIDKENIKPVFLRMDSELADKSRK